jgi:hypothetical protein
VRSGIDDQNAGLDLLKYPPEYIIGAPAGMLLIAGYQAFTCFL